MAGRAIFRQLRGITGVQRSFRCLSHVSKSLSIRHSVGQRNLSCQRIAQLRCFATDTKQETPIINIQDYADFETRVLASDVPVVVDFQADWCPPCKILCPRLESIVSRQNGKVILAKVDVDKIDDLMHRYQIQALPTVIAIHKGKKVDSFVGLQEDDVIETFVEKLIV